MERNPKRGATRRGWRWLAGLALLGATATWITMRWPNVPLAWRVQSVFEHPTERESRLFEQRWSASVAQFRAERERAPAGAIVLLGSSTLEQMPFAELFPGVLVISRAIGGEPTSYLRSRLAETMPRARPAGVLLYIGAVDFHRDRCGPAVLTGRAESVWHELQRIHPGVPGLLLGILPSRSLSGFDRERLDSANSALGVWARRNGVEFVTVDLSSSSDTQGRLRTDLSRDTYHLNSRGYEELARRLCAGAGPVSCALSAR